MGRLLRHPAFVVGGAGLAAIVLLALTTPGLTAQAAYRIQLARRLLPPEGAERARPEHPLGTDQLGRDMLTRIVFGARWSLAIAALATAAAGLAGVALGLVSGYAGGRTDALVMRAADIQLSIPAMLLAIAVAAALGPNLRNLVLVLALTGWVVYARTLRAQVLVVRRKEFIQAARAQGAGHARIVLRHVLPNALTPVIVVASQQFGFMILMEAALSFLGLGVQPPDPSWGNMIAEARAYLPVAPWVVLLPGGALTLTVLAVNLLGDGLRDTLDPKLRV